MNTPAMIRPVIRFAGLLALVAAFATARAASPEEFTAEHFQSLQDRGEPILVEISADWCPVCAAQQKVLDELYTDDTVQQVHWLKMDWDTQREAAREMGAWRQSTLVLFNNGEEVDRLIAQTDADLIASFLGQAAGG